MKIAGHKIVRVSWIDATTTGGWRLADKGGTDIIESIGILVNKEKDWVTLSASVSRWGNYLDQITIPASAIKKLKYL
jgi:hypothetical protein